MTRPLHSLYHEQRYLTHTSAVIAAIAVRNARQNLEAPGAANSCLLESPSPAAQLPPEIWGIIQRYVIDAEDWACAQNACTSSFDAPITALQVTS